MKTKLKNSLIGVMYALAFAAVVICGCTSNVTPYGGVSVHKQSTSVLGIAPDNPIGIIGVRKEFPGGTQAFCAHRSSITQDDRGWGYNECGVKLDLPL